MSYTSIHCLKLRLDIFSLILDLDNFFITMGKSELVKIMSDHYVVGHAPCIHSGKLKKKDHNSLSHLKMGERMTLHLSKCIGNQFSIETYTHIHVFGVK